MNNLESGTIADRVKRRNDQVAGRPPCDQFNMSPTVHHPRNTPMSPAMRAVQQAYSAALSSASKSLSHNGDNTHHTTPHGSDMSGSSQPPAVASPEPGPHDGQMLELMARVVTCVEQLSVQNPGRPLPADTDIKITTTNTPSPLVYAGHPDPVAYAAWCTRVRTWASGAHPQAMTVFLMCKAEAAKAFHLLLRATDDALPYVIPQRPLFETNTARVHDRIAPLISGAMPVEAQQYALSRATDRMAQGYDSDGHVLLEDALYWCERHFAPVTGEARLALIRDLETPPDHVRKEQILAYLLHLRDSVSQLEAAHLIDSQAHDYFPLLRAVDKLLDASDSPAIQARRIMYDVAHPRPVLRMPKHEFDIALRTAIGWCERILPNSSLTISPKPQARIREQHGAPVGGHAQGSTHPAVKPAASLPSLPPARCHKFFETGSCRFGDKCHFAHTSPGQGSAAQDIRHRPGNKAGAQVRSGPPAVVNSLAQNDAEPDFRQAP
jgi:hypothetical protein